MTAREQGWGRQVQQRRQAGVFDALVSTGARLEDSCWLEPGLGVASWRNRYDQTRYHKPGHHTISVYLQGGEQTERLFAPEVARDLQITAHGIARNLFLGYFGTQPVFGNGADTEASSQAAGR